MTEQSPEQTQAAISDPYPPDPAAAPAPASAPVQASAPASAPAQENAVETSVQPVDTSEPEPAVGDVVKLEGDFDQYGLVVEVFDHKDTAAEDEPTYRMVRYAHLAVTGVARTEDVATA